MAGGRGIRFALWAWLALLCALALGAPARAEGVTRLTACVAPLDAATPAESFARANAFDCARPQTDWGPGDYRVLLRGPLGTATGVDPAALQLGSVWLGSLTLHIRYADGRVASRDFDQAEISRHIALGALITLPLPRRDAPITGLMLDTREAANLRGLVLDPKVQSRDALALQTNHMIALYAGFAGLALALFVYNFVLWVTLRHRFQLWYCAMIAATAGYAFTSSGAPALIFDGLANNDRLRLNYVLLALTATAAVMFLRHFFEERIVTRAYRRLLALSCAAMTGTGLAYALLAPWAVAALDHSYFLSFGFMLMVIVPLLGRAWAKGSPYLGLFLLAWATPIVAAAMRALHGVGIVPYSFWLDNGTIIAMAVESLMSSLAIAYRIRLLSEERDQARLSESAARELADTDPLTGLLNRRAFLRQAIGGGRVCRLVLIDIDHFKLVNDRLGHDGGDEVLRLFARVLRGHAGEKRLAARLGGEEFALLARGDDFIDCEALMTALRATRMPQGLRVTASLGVAEGPIVCEEDWRALYRDADAALYAAKFSGRDCVRVAPRAVFAQAA